MKHSIILILVLMPLVFAAYESYDLTRLNDILAEAKKDSSYYLVYNHTLLWLESLDTRLNYAKEQALLLENKYMETNFNDQINSMEDNLKHGRYEQAELEYEIISSELNYTVKLLKSEINSSAYSNMVNLDTTELKELFLIKAQISELDDAEKLVIEMKEYDSFLKNNSLSSIKIKDLVAEAEYLFQTNRHYRILELKSEADNEYLNLKKRLDELNSIKDDSIRFGLMEEYKLALKSDDALESLKKTILEKKSQEIKLGTEQPDIISLIKSNYAFILAVLFSFLLFYMAFASKIKIELRKKKLEKLQKEKLEINNKMITAQNEYFVEKTISKKSYELKMSDFRKRLVWIIKEIALLKNDDKSK